MRNTLSGTLGWVVFGISGLVALALPACLAVVYAPKYGLLRVPLASWFVLALIAPTIVIAGLVCLFFWQRWRRTARELAALRGQPLKDDIPTVLGHKQLNRAEFLTLLQILFRRPPDVKHIRTTPLPGGHGGSAVVLVNLHRGDEPDARSYVVKLGQRREMADEHEKFLQYVQDRLPNAAQFFRYAAWEELAGIAYEFVGLEPEREVQSLYQSYKGHAPVEVAELVERIYKQLGQAWHRHGGTEAVDLYTEYDLLWKKRETIIGHVSEIVDEDDAYRINFSAVEQRLRPHLKPDFLPEIDAPWHDPVAFLRTWPSKSLTLSVHRSIVHGDLHAQNVLIEIGRDGHRRPWFIDFSHTGNGLSGTRSREAAREGHATNLEAGHTLRDFARLEADVKFILTVLWQEDDLRLAGAFEQALIESGMILRDTPAGENQTQLASDPRFQKAWAVIREIRRQATHYLASAEDARPYWLSLLHATLPIVYYQQDQFENQACELQQKRYALLSAGMVCSQL